MYHYEVLDRMVHDRELSAYDRAVFLAIMSYAGKDMTCFPAVPQLAARAGVAVRTVQNTIKKLLAKGYMTKKFRYNKSNYYQIMLSPAPGAPYAPPGAPDALDPVHQKEGGGAPEAHLTQPTTNKPMNLNPPHPPNGGRGEGVHLNGPDGWGDRVGDPVRRGYERTADWLAAMAEKYPWWMWAWRIAACYHDVPVDKTMPTGAVFAAYAEHRREIDQLVESWDYESVKDELRKTMFEEGLREPVKVFLYRLNHSEE